MLVQTETGAQQEVSLSKVTPENYIVPQGEENVYHVRQEIVKFDPETGERLSTPRLQKYGKKMFESFIHHELKQQGYTLTILSSPQMVAEKKAKVEAEAKAKAEAEAKAKAEKKAAKK